MLIFVVDSKGKVSHPTHKCDMTLSIFYMNKKRD